MLSTPKGHGRLNGRIKADPALRSIQIIAVSSYALNGKDKKANDSFLCPTPRVNCRPKVANTILTDGFFAAAPCVSCCAGFWSPA
jgi:hypothetical protein